MAGRAGNKKSENETSENVTLPAFLKNSANIVAENIYVYFQLQGSSKKNIWQTSL